MPGTQKCPICSAEVQVSERYPNHVCSECWSKAVDENGRSLAFGYSLDVGYCILYEDTKEPRDTGICFIEGIRCWAGEDYWGGSVVCYPYEGESR